MSIKARLKRLEDAASGISLYPDVVQLIKNGVYYDQLTDDQKDRYVQYRYGISRKVYEDLELMVNFEGAPYDFLHTDEDIKESGVFHFQLDYVPRPPTAEEMEKNRQEIEAFCDREIPPEEEAANKAEHQLLCHINELRHAAVERGEDPNQYPAPWQAEYETKRYLYET